MRIQLVSDVHCEFHDDHGLKWFDKLDIGQADVLVVAGDLAPGSLCLRTLELICDKYGDKPVVYVAGNHELYGFAKHKVHQGVRELEKKYSNLTFLEKDVREVKGRRWIGATGWYPDTGYYNWSDFKHVPGLQAWLQPEYLETRDFFKRELKENDIVVTHMLPSRLLTAQEWEHSDNNRFFINDMTDLILERKPAFWLHGHCHVPMWRKVGDTLCIRRPYGYPHERKSRNSEDSGLFEIQDLLGTTPAT